MKKKTDMKKTKKKERGKLNTFPLLRLEIFLRMNMLLLCYFSTPRKIKNQYIIIGIEIFSTNF